MRGCLCSHLEVKGNHTKYQISVNSFSQASSPFLCQICSPLPCCLSFSILNVFFFCLKHTCKPLNPEHMSHNYQCLLFLLPNQIGSIYCLCNFSGADLFLIKQKVAFVLTFLRKMSNKSLNSMTFLFSFPFKNVSFSDFCEISHVYFLCIYLPVILFPNVSFSSSDYAQF